MRRRANTQARAGRNAGTRHVGQTAFTLVELLVVIAVIAILASLLLPALSRAKSKASAIQCLGQMRQVGLATVMYASDHQEQLPRSTHSAAAFNQLPWGFALGPYLTGKEVVRPDAAFTNLMNGLYHCPRDRRPLAQWSYGKSVYPELSPEETGGPVWPRLTQIPRPTGTVLYAEKSGGSMADHFMAHFWLEGGSPEIDRFRHDRQSNFTFFDGHARKLRFEMTFDLANKLDNWNPATAR